MDGENHHTFIFQAAELIVEGVSESLVYDAAYGEFFKSSNSHKKAYLGHFAIGKQERLRTKQSVRIYRKWELMGEEK